MERQDFYASKRRASVGRIKRVGDPVLRAARHARGTSRAADHRRLRGGRFYRRGIRRIIFGKVAESSAHIAFQISTWLSLLPPLIGLGLTLTPASAAATWVYIVCYLIIGMVEDQSSSDSSITLLISRPRQNAQPTLD